MSRKVMSKRTFKLGGFSAAVVGLALLAGSVTIAQAQSLDSNSLTLNNEQVAEGRKIVGQSCSECHGVTLRGALGPALRDEGFTGSWGQRPLTALHDYTTSAMPPAGPGTLSEEQYNAIMAFILSNNGFEKADDGVAITAENLGEIVFK